MYMLGVLNRGETGVVDTSKLLLVFGSRIILIVGRSPFFLSQILVKWQRKLNLKERATTWQKY